MTLEEAKRKKIQELTDSHQAEINTGRYFNINGKQIFVKKDLEGANWMIQLMNAGVLASPSPYWDKQLVEHSLGMAELQSLVAQAGIYSYQRYAYCMGLVQQVKNATTIEQVNAIDY